MNIVPIDVDLMFVTPNALELIELAGRVAYKSEDRIGPGTAEPFVRMLVNKKPRPHLSVIEHAHATLRFVVDRGVAHEQVRHRLCSYTQESTRFCNYGKKGGISVVKPLGIPDGTEGYEVWLDLVRHSESAYMRLLELGFKPQDARAVLTLSTKTEIVHTANLHEWRHILDVRTAPDAHPHIRHAMTEALRLLSGAVPVVFDDLRERQGL